MQWIGCAEDVLREYGEALIEVAAARSASQASLRNVYAWQQINDHERNSGVAAAASLPRLQTALDPLSYGTVFDAEDPLGSLNELRIPDYAIPLLCFSGSDIRRTIFGIQSVKQGSASTSGSAAHENVIENTKTAYCVGLLQRVLLSLLGPQRYVSVQSSIYHSRSDARTPNSYHRQHVDCKSSVGHLLHVMQDACIHGDFGAYEGVNHALSQFEAAVGEELLDGGADEDMSRIQVNVTLWENQQQRLSYLILLHISKSLRAFLNRVVGARPALEETCVYRGPEPFGEYANIGPESDDDDFFDHEQIGADPPYFSLLMCAVHSNSPECVQLVLRATSPLTNAKAQGNMLHSSPSMSKCSTTSMLHLPSNSHWVQRILRAVVTRVRGCVTVLQSGHRQGLPRTNILEMLVDSLCTREISHAHTKLATEPSTRRAGTAVVGNGTSYWTLLHACLTGFGSYQAYVRHAKKAHIGAAANRMRSARRRTGISTLDRESMIHFILKRRMVKPYDTCGGAIGHPTALDLAAESSAWHNLKGMLELTYHFDADFSKPDTDFDFSANGSSAAVDDYSDRTLSTDLSNPDALTSSASSAPAHSLPTRWTTLDVLCDLHTSDQVRLHS